MKGINTPKTQKLKLGNWVSKNVSTVYQAPTDGIVVCYGHSNGDSQYMQILTDSSNPPTTIRTKGYAYAGQYMHNVGLSCPIKKGDYWEVLTDCGNTNYVYWIPLE